MLNMKKWMSTALSCTLAASVLTAAAPVYAAAEEGGAAEADFTEQELKANDYILYFVNAGDSTPATAEAGDKLGLYASLTEQAYADDPATGKAWGLVTATSAASVSDQSAKTGSLRYYNGPQVREKSLEYKFELPAGEYDITFGFQNPWSGRSVNLFLEETNVSGGDLAIGGSGTLTEKTYRKIGVSDGELNVHIQGPESAALTVHNDPLINYLIVRQNRTVPLAELASKLEEARTESGNTGYTPYSVSVLNAAIAEADELLKSLEDSGADIAEPAVQEQIRAAISKLSGAIAALALNVPNTSFKPGEVWRDTNGAVIQAHGAGIMYDEKTETYYWYGEDKTNGYLPARGVRVYASKDLYNWEDKGLALTAIESMVSFETDPLISGLYAGREDKADILNDIGTNRIIERPKVIYNDTTKKYVMWMHTDGPSATSNANYAKAEAGYALSDSPTGPFVYQESNRMDRVPAGATDDGQPNQPGMARDMTLFKDDDGTAYLIYSSEENLTIYISKLNESYTDVVGWDQDGDGKRDSEYKAVYGTDYVRVFPLAQREAPAMFKYQGKYYLITSGATGWDPNVGKYTVADNIMGPWKTMREVAPGSSTTFSSQSTNVIPVDPEAGKFIYMGDRWKSSDLADSRYVWLPIEFGQNDEIALRWHDEWTLGMLDGMGRVTVNTELPASAKLGEAPQLPSSLNVTLSDGRTIDTPVTWSVTDESFLKPGPVLISGVLPELANKKLDHRLYVVPDGKAYFVHAGGAATADYLDMTGLMGKEDVLNGDVIDQKYDPASGQTWGYVGDSTNASGTSSGDLFGSLRYLLGNSGDDLTYKFELENGEYDVYVGLYDPWAQYSNGNRKADIILNGTTLTSSYVFTNARDVLAYDGVNVEAGQLELTVHRSADAGASSSDPQISWIMIAVPPKATGPVTVPVTPPDEGEEGEGGEEPSTGPGETGQEPAFAEISGHWALGPINKLAEKNILGGFPDGSFKPDKRMSRAEFSAVIFRLLGLEPDSGQAPFTDTPSDLWYSQYINGIYALGLVSGFPDGTFGPSREMTREEAFVILYRAVKDRLPEAGEADSFTDAESVSGWAKEAIEALTEAGVIEGYEDGTLRPKGTITRAEIAAIVASFA
ncbi:S-layer homology domain-containing protein [Paenibacillus sp. N4]|nr:S-layer homology domain-containing protein [Paenibacillus vietnamensis]